MDSPAPFLPFKTINSDNMKKTLLALVWLTLPSLMSAQLATDAYQFSQPDLKGTARFMSMGGAFGALGADMSVLSQNPGGIGVYRSNEIGFTVDLDAQHSRATSQHFSSTWDKTPFYLNNIGIIFTVRSESALRNFNMGFTYNKTSSFNNRFRGGVPELNTSITNYIAALANGGGVTVGDVAGSNTFDPYNPNDGGYQAPWATILGYESYYITPRSEADGKIHWDGQFGEGTTGNGYFKVIDKGAMDEYNIALGGNINNWLYWGMDFGIINFDYERQSTWGESMQNAYVATSDNVLQQTTSDISLWNGYHVSGSGFNYKLGFIFKPIQELRIGIAMHTPTWYSLEQSYLGRAYGDYGNHRSPITQYTNNGYDAYYDYRFRTPWKLIFSAAGVIANRFIISADYEWANYRHMHFSDKYDDDFFYETEKPFYYTNSDIKDIYRSTSTMRIGAEARLSSSVSLRAGYSLSSSPVKESVRNGETEVFGDGTRMDYTLNDRTYYITGGIGFHHKGFYTDLAYVYRNRNSSWHPYPTDIQNPELCPKVSVTNTNHQIVLSMGYKF